MAYKPTDRYQNWFVTKLAVGVTDEQTTLTLANELFVNNGRLVIDPYDEDNREIVRVTALNGIMVDVIRGDDNTAPAYHLKDSIVAMEVVAGDLNELYEDWDAAQADIATAIGDAETATTNATTATGLANTATGNANTATGLANTATSNANSAATNANNVADALDDFNVTIGTVGVGTAAASITGTMPNKKLNLVLEKGAKGDIGVGVPTGGTIGQTLLKNSATDYDFTWNVPPTAPVTSVAGKVGDVTLGASDLTATGISGTKFLRGDNTWQTPSNTTYSEITEAEINTGTASTLRTITARSVTYILGKVRSMLGSEIQFVSGKVGINKAPTLGDLDVAGDIYSSGDKVITEGTASAGISIIRSNFPVTGSRFSTTSTSEVLVGNSTFTYTSGDTEEILWMGFDIMAMSSGIGSFQMYVNNNPFGAQVYVDGSQTWLRTGSQDTITMPANTTWTIKIMVKSSSGATTSVTTETAYWLPRVTGIAVPQNVKVISSNVEVAGLQTPDADWIVPTYKNGWVDYGAEYNSLGYRMDASGYVHLKGMVKSGTVFAAIFTLPIGYRPLRQHITSNISNGLVSRVDINAAGDVIILSGSSAWASIDDLVFKAEQ